MSMTCAPYISFPGNAAEAFPYYRELFGGELSLMTYDQFPSTEDFPFDPPHGSVAHATLEAPGITLTGGDAMGEALPEPRNDVYSFLLGFDTEDAARAFLGKVTDTGGQMAMPVAGAPWGDRYGQGHDPFGLPWDVVVPGTRD